MRILYPLLAISPSVSPHVCHPSSLVSLGSATLACRASGLATSNLFLVDLQGVAIRHIELFAVSFKVPRHQWMAKKEKWGMSIQFRANLQGEPGCHQIGNEQ